MWEICGKGAEKILQGKDKSGSIFGLKKIKLTLNLDFCVLHNKNKLKKLISFEVLVWPLQNPVPLQPLQRCCLVKGNPRRFWSPYERDEANKPERNLPSVVSYLFKLCILRKSYFFLFFFF